MGKINGCLKCLFIFFNVLFGIVGILLVVGAVKASAYVDALSSVGGPHVGWMWVFAIGVLTVSVFGVVTGCLEKELVLKIFAGLMVLGLLIMLIIGIIIAAYRNKLKSGFESGASQFAETFMTDETFRTSLRENQRAHQCCGVTGPKDWGTEVDISCSCMQPSGCMPRPEGMTGPSQVYSMSCGSIIFSFFDFFFKIGMGFFFGFAVTALLGLLVSLLMIFQVRRYDGMGGQSIAMK